jgi:hypothetical protein
MQERCAKDARVWFAAGEENGTFFPAHTFIHYSNHLNRGQNRCFALVTATEWSTEILHGQPVPFPTDYEWLFDVEDNRLMGSYYEDGASQEKSLGKEGIYCLTYGEPKACRGINDWAAFEKRYMEQ